MKALVFGDSHAACVIEAWRAGGWPADWQMSFFVRPGSGPPEHAVTGTTIRAVTPGFLDVLARLDQPTEHDLAAQDAFVIIGGGISLFPLVQVLNTYDILDWGGEIGAETRPTITEPVLRLAVAEAFRATPAGRLLAELRAVPELADRPIHLMPQPFPSEKVLVDRSIASGAGLRRLARLRLLARAATLFHETTKDLARELGAQLHRQPEPTIHRHAFTALPYSTEARRLVNLTQAQPKTDILHANRDYGVLLLQGLAAGADTKP